MFEHNLQIFWTQPIVFWKTTKTQMTLQQQDVLVAGDDATQMVHLIDDIGNLSYDYAYCFCF